MIVGRTKGSFGYKKTIKRWGQIYKQMKYEMEENWIQEETIIRSYQFATNHRSRKWLFNKWITAILKWHGYTEKSLTLLQVNSDRAVEKVTRRHWYDAQKDGTTCQCFHCKSGWGVHIPNVEYATTPFFGPVQRLEPESEYQLEAWIIHHSQAV